VACEQQNAPTAVEYVQLEKDVLPQSVGTTHGSVGLWQ
jgi:hypothetical protein